ncbi:hypothetical protein NEIRO02_1501 [Nematocida sp. AWRm79]|nr:hypothetical protein NEIRO02_1501 [Nematocida sp. AWRm79]
MKNKTKDERAFANGKKFFINSSRAICVKNKSRIIGSLLNKSALLVSFSFSDECRSFVRFIKNPVIADRIFICCCTVGFVFLVTSIKHLTASDMLVSASFSTISISLSISSDGILLFILILIRTDIVFFLSSFVPARPSISKGIILLVTTLVSCTY